MTNKAARKTGRPFDYLPEFADQAAKLCRLGATDAEIADFFEKDERTINRWKIDHPEFCQALKDGKFVSDKDVADRLHQRALGFEFEEAQAHKLKTVEYKDGKRLKETERLEIIMVKRVVPTDTTACMRSLPDAFRSTLSALFVRMRSFDIGRAGHAGHRPHPG